MGDELEIDEYAAKHTLAFFRNMGRPDILIMPKEGESLGENERDRLEQWWNDKLQGFWRRFKPLFLKQPMDVTLIEQKFKDMQLTELREKEADTILQTWGIAPEIFGRLKNSNKATITEAKDLFARFALVPRLERQREALQQFLVPDYDDRIILTYDSPIPHDKAHALMVVKTQPNAFLLNEIRNLAGSPPLDELADEFGQARGGAGNQGDGNGDRRQAGLEGLSDEDLKTMHEILLRARYTHV